MTVFLAILCLFGSVPISPPVTAADELKVKVRFTSAPDDDVQDKLKQVSRLTGDEKKTVNSVAALRRAAENDVPRLKAVLRSEGYYTPEIQFDVSGEGRRYELNYKVESGPKFKITDYDIIYIDQIENNRPKTLKDAGLKSDGSPRGRDIAKLQRDFVTYLHNNGFPAARLAERRVEAVPATGEAVVQLSIESGPRAVYGDVEWDGLERTEEAYLNKFVPWEQGAEFELKQLTTFRDSLAKTGLFASVDVQPATTDPEGTTPIRVQVAERPPRTVGVGASYSTNVGAGGRVFWEHRNFFGRAENLHIEANVAEIKQVGVVSFRKPRAAERGVWFVRLEGGNEDSDAFSGLKITARTGFERKLGEPWTVSAALEGEWSNFEDTFGKREATLGALPVRAVYDTTNDILNPTKGFKVSAQLTPAMGVSDDLFQFTMFELKGAGHIPFDDNASYVAAMWGRFGTTLGAPLGDIPANRRFYAGGAGSVRGYGYQLLSPLDENLDPIGARSVLEGGVEFRVKFTKSIGMVTFIEAGRAFASGVPDLQDDILIGAGAGFRYYTAIGPIRLDVAVPLEKRDGVDDDLQFYISLGQAF